jgi:hypothetical protein
MSTSEVRVGGERKRHLAVGLGRDERPGHAAPIHREDDALYQWQPQKRIERPDRVCSRQYYNLPNHSLTNDGSRPAWPVLRRDWTIPMCA